MTGTGEGTPAGFGIHVDKADRTPPGIGRRTTRYEGHRRPDTLSALSESLAQVVLPAAREVGWMVPGKPKR